MRMVLDTNVLARAGGPDNPAEQLLEICFTPLHTLVTSDYQLSELDRVLRYDRVRAIHGRSNTEIDAYLRYIRDASFVVPLPSNSMSVVPSDPDDDPIVATAVLGQAHVLCTWDRHLFADSVQEYLSQVGIRVMRDTDVLREISGRKAA